VAIRPAGLEDLAAIASLWHCGWIDAHLGHVPEALLPHRRLEDLRQRAAERLSDIHAAMFGLKVVGFIAVHGDEIEQLYVAAAARGTGVADALLAHGESLIAGRGDTAWLAVVAGNTRARRFYARNGWRDCGAFLNPARIANGTLPVPSLRYEKQLKPIRAAFKDDRRLPNVDLSQ
jgi:ribosomal protein S18 acetylase RimI-like enzyme